MLTVMIAEDNVMNADMLEDILVAGGYRVCGIAGTVAEAIALGALHKPDLAIIDMRLADGGVGSEIAANFRGSGCGILYATGNTRQLMLTPVDGDACLSKPFRAPDILRALEIVAEMKKCGTASQPFPRGFQVLSKVL